jgi:homoserine kinase
LPLVGDHGILGAALSGAGPSILVIVDREANLPRAQAAIRGAIDTPEKAELLVCRFQSHGASEL